MEFEKLINLYENNELKQLLKLVKEETIFFDDNKRLLSKNEIINYKEDLNISIDIIPLIDLGDNIFLVYNPNENKFQKCDISEEILYNNILSIEKYINQIYEKLSDTTQPKKK